MPAETTLVTKRSCITDGMRASTATVCSHTAMAAYFAVYCSLTVYPAVDPVLTTAYTWFEKVTVRHMASA